MAETKTKMKAPDTLSVAELREKIGDAQKTIRVDVGVAKDVISGSSPADFIARCARIAKDNGLSDFKLGWKSSGGAYKKTGKRDRWGDYKTDYVSWKDTVQIVGTRPYTDDELVKEGPKLITRIEKERKREAAERAKKLAALNKLNRELGYPEVTELPAE